MSEQYKSSKILKMNGVPDNLRHIWEKAGEAIPKKVVSEQETEDALASIWNQIDENEKPNKLSIWKWMAVAAAVILTVSAGYLNFYTKTIYAPVGEIVMVQLPDGSNIQLVSNSSISYKPLFGITHRTLSLNGEAEFDVERNPELQFIVQSPSMRTSVLGTVFKVTDWQRATTISPQVVVQEGNVAVESPVNRVELVANQMVEYSRSLEKLNEVQLSDESKINFKNDRLTFNNVEIHEFFEQIQLYYNTEIDVTRVKENQFRISATYRFDATVQEIINDITTVKGLKYEAVHNGYIVSE